MLLPINEMSCHADLYAATNLAGQVLAYIANSQLSALDEVDFGQQDSAFAWLLGRPAAVKNGIKAIFALSSAERHDLLTAFQNDIQFDTRFDDPNYEFLFPKLSDSIKDKGGDFLVALYEDVLAKSGFKNLVGQQVIPLDKYAVEKGYRDSNSGAEEKLPLCPACLIEYLPNPVNRGGNLRSNVDREHFFPKSIYSPLSVHPMNIVLTCIKCNQRAHHDIDPIDIHGPGSLGRSFIPYKRPGIDELELEFRREKGKLMISFINQNAAIARSQNFDRLYNILSLWSEISYSHVYTSLIRYVKMRYNSQTITEQLASQVLQDVVSNAFQYKYSQQHAYLEIECANWILKHKITSFTQDCQ